MTLAGYFEQKLKGKRVFIPFHNVTGKVIDFTWFTGDEFGLCDELYMTIENDEDGSLFYPDISPEMEIEMLD
jgi:hypothetical protein